MAMAQRILIVNSLFFPNLAGGTEFNVLRLGRELSARGHHVDVLASSGRHEGEARLVARRVDGISGEVFEAPSAGRLDIVSDPVAAKPGLAIRGLHHFGQVRDAAWHAWTQEALERARPDVVNTHSLVGLTSSVWEACRRRGLPVVHSLHDLQLLCPRTTLQRSSGAACDGGPLPCQLLRGWKRRRVRGLALVTGPSRFVLERHRDFGFFADVPSEVVPNAVDHIPPRLPDRSTRPVATGLYVGRLNAQKGVPQLLAALEALYAAEPALPLTFAFAGDGPLRPQVEAFAARRADRVRYFGHVEPEVRDALFHESDFLILPSATGEVFGLAIIEGFSWGLPAIGSDRGGIPEVIRDGEDGQVVAPTSAALAAAIARYALDGELRRQHGAAARDRALDFTVQTQATRFLAIYARAGALTSGRTRQG